MTSVDLRIDTTYRKEYERTMKIATTVLIKSVRGHIVVTVFVMNNGSDQEAC